MRRIRWTAEDLAKVTRMRAEGHRDEEIGIALGRTTIAIQSQVIKLRQRDGSIPRQRRNTWTPENLALVRRLQAEGLTHAQMAQRIGTSKTRIGRMLEAAGDGPIETMPEEPAKVGNHRTDPRLVVRQLEQARAALIRAERRYGDMMEPVHAAVSEALDAAHRLSSPDRDAAADICEFLRKKGFVIVRRRGPDTVIPAIPSSATLASVPVLFSLSVMPPVPRTLAEYPWASVTVSCKLCSRRGVYRLARLAARYGPEQTLDDLLADLAHRCPYWRSKPRQYEVRCGARFEELDRLRPADVPGQAAPRAREPSRESLPQRRSSTPPAAGAGRTLSSWEREDVTIVCDKCGRRDTYQVAALLAAEGDARLTDLRATLTSACPRVARADMSDWCGAKFEPG